MENQKILIDEMKHLGFTLYESKVYLTLLKVWPINGYMLSKESGVPRSKIYEVINNLIKKKLIYEKKIEKTSTYLPLEPNEFIKKIRNNFTVMIDHVEEETTSIYLENSTSNDSKIILGRDNIFEFIIQMIDKAEFRIDVSLWEEEYNFLSKSILCALDRGISVKGIYFGCNNPLIDVITHRRIDTYLKEKEQRYIICIIDNKEAISGIISRGEESQVTWTNDYGAIDIVQDYIVHDLMINSYSNDLEANKKNIFEEKLDKIRKNYFSD